MKSMGTLLLALLVCTSGAMAGEMFGTILYGGKPIAQGVTIEINASGKTYKTETDKFGSYRIFVKGKGKCTLTVHLKEELPSAEAFSYDKSTRYDWVLEAKDAKLSLRRK